MHSEHQVAWDKLSTELGLLSVEAPSSIIPLVIGINSLLDPQASQCLRKINFMSYEVAAKCGSYSEPNRLHILNDYFFGVQRFKIVEEESHELWSLHYVVNEKQGAPLPVALIYLQLAAYMDLPFYIIQLQGFRMMKWALGKQSKYINLANRGKLLDERQILEVLNNTTHNGDIQEDSGVLRSVGDPSNESLITLLCPIFN